MGKVSFLWDDLDLIEDLSDHGVPEERTVDMLKSVSMTAGTKMLRVYQFLHLLAGQLLEIINSYESVTNNSNVNKRALDKLLNKKKKQLTTSYKVRNSVVGFILMADLCGVSIYELN